MRPASEVRAGAAVPRGRAAGGAGRGRAAGVRAASRLLPLHARLPLRAARSPARRLLPQAK